MGGASGFWGESDMGLPQLLAKGSVDYVIFDYLAEITMSIMARARAKDASRGYATDFVETVMRSNLPEVARQGVKILSNAGGMNPEACAAAIREYIEEAGLSLKVATVYGDDLTSRADEFVEQHEMFSGAPFPLPAKIASINAYIGAFPIAQALAKGADIVITGRCVDSALTLAACVYEFGWTEDDWDKLSAGSLAGHLIECGPQAVGGNFTDWQFEPESLVDAGYPIAIIEKDGTTTITKPDGTGGIVNVGTVAEQMLYEIGDPQSYLLPDVSCDFSEVVLEQIAENQVRASGAKGRPAPQAYKVCATYSDGFRISTVWHFVGQEARAKARRFANNAIARANKKLAQSNLGEYGETYVETLGDESHFGRFARAKDTREVVLKLGARHPDPQALGMLLKEATGLALAAPPGLSVDTGGRARPVPVVRLFSFLIPKGDVQLSMEFDGTPIKLARSAHVDVADNPPLHEGPVLPEMNGERISVSLRQLVWGRSGDKGDKANIGLIPRDAKFAPWIWSQVTEEAVAERFAHFLKGKVERFYLPGTGSINLLLHDVLGGGGMASMRSDPQGKAYAQILLDMEVAVPAALLGEI